MTTYTWPGFGVNRFEMSIKPNFRVYTNVFNASAQAIDLTGERWQVTIGMTPGNNAERGAAIEAFFDRLIGPVNRVSLWNLRRPTPLGTLSDATGSAVWYTNSAAVATWSTSAPATATWSYIGPTLYEDVEAGSNTLPIHRTPGTTVKAGDHVGVGGQLFRIMADATADSNSRLTVEVLPRVRTALSRGAAVTCTRPTATFMLRSDTVPVTWSPGMYSGGNFDLVEAP